MFEKQILTFDIYLNNISNIKHKDLCSSVMLRLATLDSETGWTGERWSETNLL